VSIINRIINKSVVFCQTQAFLICIKHKGDDAFEDTQSDINYLDDAFEDTQSDINYLDDAFEDTHSDINYLDDAFEITQSDIDYLDFVSGTTNEI
jgi:peptidoglycan hydrolase CwlO-like protein